MPSPLRQSVVEANDLVGLNSFGGEVHAKGGSIMGGLHGIRLRPDTQGIGNGANVILDNVQVQGQTGAAILATSGVTSHIQVLNYTRLLSGNGILLDVQEASNVTMEVVGSTLEGKLNVADNSTANLAFQHGLMAGDVLVGEASTTALHLDRSELRGNIDIADNSKGDLIFDQSQMTGDVLVNDSTATVVFANGSNLEGNVSFTGNSSAGLTFDQSQMKGDVLIDSLPDTTAVNFANNSVLTGNVNIAGVCPSSASHTRCLSAINGQTDTRVVASPVNVVKSRTLPVACTTRGRGSSVLP